MNRMMRLWIPAISLLLILFAAQAVQPAAADFVQWESSWVVNVNFVGNQPNASLTVKVWALGTDFYVEGTEDMKCYPSAGVVFANDQAIFSGLDGIRCAMPDMAAMVYKLTDVPEAPAPPFVLPEECDCKKGAYAQAVLDLDGNSTPTNWMNPIFSMQDLALDMPVDAGMATQAYMTFEVDDSTSSSDIFSGNHATTLARFRSQAGLSDVYNVDFTANGFSLKATPSSISEDLAISTQQKILHIGYSPVTGEGMHGRLSSLTVDPGCFGVD